MGGLCDFGVNSRVWPDFHMASTKTENLHWYHTNKVIPV